MEDAALHPLGDPLTRICNINVDPLVFEDVGEGYLPLARHGIDGVLNEIFEDPRHE